MKIVSISPEQTLALGQKMGEELKGGEILLLGGDLGAGKTVFTKGIAKGLCIADEIVSPTFTIMNEYSGRLQLYHFDAYRLSSGEEAVQAGLGDYIGRTDGVCVIEWYQNIQSLIGGLAVKKISIAYKNESDREITVHDQ